MRTYLAQNITKTALSLWVIFLTMPHWVNAQKARSNFQQDFISRYFIDPQFQKSGPLKVTSDGQMDSLFTAIGTAWKKVADDTLKAHPMDVSPADFKHIDAYCYFWTWISITQQLDMPKQQQQHLVNAYMLPAMFNDLKTLNQNPSITSVKLIYTGTLNNTLGLGSDDRMDKETVLKCYDLYTAFDKTFRSLFNADTAISNYARKQLTGIEPLKYDLKAKAAYYNGDTEQAYIAVLTGLSTDQYPKRRLQPMARNLLASFKQTGDTDKSLALLNTIAQNTTADNISRDILLRWYLAVDSVKGRQMYSRVQGRLAGSSFKKTGQIIKLPVNWEFICKQVPAERLKKVKYFLVDVWYTSCGPCLAEIPENNAIYEHFKNRPDVLFVGINTDYKNGNYSKAYVTATCKELNVNFPVIYDTDKLKISHQLAVNSYPQKFIINTKGEILAKTDQSPIERKSFDLFVSEL